MTTATKITAHTITSAATGLHYDVELADGTATICWLDADGIDQFVESAAPGGVLAACDVPDGDQALISAVVAWLEAGSPRNETFDLEVGGETIADFFTVRMTDDDDLEVSFPTREGDDPAADGFFPEEAILDWASMVSGVPLALEGGAIDSAGGVTTEVWTLREASLR